MKRAELRRLSEEAAVPAMALAFALMLILQEPTRHPKRAAANQPPVAFELTGTIVG